MKKIIIISTIITIVLFGLLEGKNIYIYIQNKISPQPISTGAVLEPIPTSVVESYSELYDLLDQSIIIESGFTITPIPKERKIEVSLEVPIENNKAKFLDWLAKSKYSHIPQKNIIYIEVK